MRTTRLQCTLAAGVVASLLILTTGNAKAADGDPCAALTDEDNAIPKVYIENGDTQEPMLKKLGAALMASTNKIRLIYRNRPTCNIRNDMFAAAGPITMTTVADGATARPVKYIPSDPTKQPLTCTVPAPGDASAVPIALGIGATYLTSCPAMAQPANMSAFEGPNQAYGFITHPQSKQIAITYEEGYLAFGFTEGLGEASPWISQALRFKRGVTASTTLTMSSAIGLQPAQMLTHAPDEGTSELLITDMLAAGAANPDASIGVLGMDLYDIHRSDVIVLPFKTKNQKYAYYPDKTSASFDKQNVRDGHYLPWAPTPYMTVLDGAGTDPTHIVNANVKRIFNLVINKVAGDDVDGLAALITSGLIPKCAMKVTRAGDGLDLSLYSDPAPCDCYFNKTVPQGSSTCTVCTDGNNAPCGAGVCRLGFCEAK